LRLEFLADALGAGVPDALRGAMADAAMRVTALERDRALYAARAASGDGGFDQVRRGSSVPARARLLRWLLLPSPSYMRADAAAGGRVLSVMYVRRVLKYLTARFRQPAGSS
jgi:hypothetical protein